MPHYQVLKSYMVPKPEGGGHYSRGVVVEMDEKTAEDWKEYLQPYVINDGPHGPERRIELTQSELDERIAEAVDKARAEWIAEAEAAAKPVKKKSDG